MSKFWSPIVDKLVPYTPGEQPKHRHFVKLNTNENPYGPSPKALAAMQKTVADEMRLYPDPVAGDLRAAIAKTHGLKPEHIFVGNGSDEVLAHAFNAFFRDKGKLRFADVTYSFYPTFCQLYEIPFDAVPLDDSFRYDLTDYLGPKAGVEAGVVIANPNAPTGIAMGLDAIEDVLKANPDVVVLIDEAYVDFGAESAMKLIDRYENLLVVQTFSKSRSLAGLRVGFAAGHPHLIEGLTRIKDSFNSYPLNRLSLSGGLAAWNDRAWFEETRRKVMIDRDRTAESLRDLGFSVLPSSANFVFASHGSTPAEEIFAGLREHGVLVRHFKQPRIHNWLRISIGTAEDCQALISSTRDILGV